MGKLKYLALLIIIMLSYDLSAKNIDSLEIYKIARLKNSIDSISKELNGIGKKVNDNESEIVEYRDTMQHPIQIIQTKSILESLSNILTIILSIITLIYVAKADRINTIFGSYSGKKRYMTLQKELLDLTLTLEDIKKEFNDFINSNPDTYVKDGVKDLASIKRIVDKINNSQYFTHAQNFTEDNQELIYDTLPNTEIIYRFNNYIEAMKKECSHIITLKEGEIEIRINEAKEIKQGEKKIK